MVQSFTEVKNLFTNYLQDNLYHQEPQKLYDPINYILSLGGKRARPVMCLMAANMWGPINENSKKVAMAIEVFHNFTLISDDIMDRAKIRRGQPTVHVKYDLNTAVLSSDAMLIEAINCLLDIDDEKNIGTIIRRFCQYAMDVCYGQQYDINFETRDDVQLTEYIEMIRLKTAVLLGCSLSLGGFVAGAKNTDIEHLQLFGENIGIAFQLWDDYLDTFGDQASFGKKIGGDILQNKKTYLYLKSLELADEQQKEKLVTYFDKDFVIDENDKIQEITELYLKLGVNEYISQVIEAYHDLGMSHLAAINVPQENKQEIINLAETLLKRKS